MLPDCTVILIGLGSTHFIILFRVNKGFSTQLGIRIFLNYVSDMRGSRIFSGEGGAPPDQGGSYHGYLRFNPSHQKGSKHF